jgi:hypothetical protein
MDLTHNPPSVLLWRGKPRTGTIPHGFSVRLTSRGSPVERCRARMMQSFNSFTDTLQLDTALYIAVRILISLNWIPWPESASDLYRPSDRHLSVKLVPTFADRVCGVVSATDPRGRILEFTPEPLLFLPSSSSTVPDPRLLRQSGRAGNRTRSSGSVARNSDR